METQTLKIHLVQGTSEFTIKMQGIEADAETSLIVGTALNELFHWINLQKRMNVRNGLKLSQPIEMRIEGEQFGVLGIGSVHTIMRERLKMNSKAKSKKAYALKFVECISEALRVKKAIEVKEVLSNLDAEIEIEDAIKA